MEREDDAPEALLTRGDRIVAVGTLSDLRRQAPRAQAYDLQGKTLLPGFVDAHSHITQFAKTLRLVSLSGCRSEEEIRERLQRHMRERPPRRGEWVLGFGYDDSELSGRKHPEQQILDAVSVEFPILITHVSGHMGVLNSRALCELHISGETQDPAGGRIGRKPGSREPNGFLEETAFTDAASRIPAASPEEELCMLEQAQEIYLSYGITTAQEGKADAAAHSLLTEAARCGKLVMDVISYLDYFQTTEELREQARLRQDHSGRYRLGGYKIFLDGSPQGRTAWLTQPYCNAADGYRGYPAHTADEVREAVQESVQDGMQLLAHCNGDAAAKQFLDACRREDGIRALRPVMIHAQLLRGDQLPVLREIGMIPSFFVTHCWYWGDAHIRNLGRERADRISPLGTAARLGIPFTLHQDTPVLQPDLLEAVWCAVTRRTKEGQALAPDERVSPWEALKAVTCHGAYQYFEERDKGTLAPGKRADLVVLDQNPLSVPPERLREIRVLETIKDGNSRCRAAGN